MAGDVLRTSVRRRRVLRRLGAGLATATITTTAGCSGDGSSADATAADGTATDGSATDDSTGGIADGDGTGDGSPGGGGTGDVDVGQESIGSVRDHDIEGIEVVGWESELAGGNGDDGQERFEITLAVENVGEETTDATEYLYQAFPSDGDGAELNVFTQENSVGVTTDPEIAPGERTVVYTIPDVANPGDVASYELTVTCGSLDDGIYCPE